MKILKDWTDDHTKAFQNGPLTFSHGLSETGLFTDEALIELINRHPSEELDVCAMPFPGESVFRTVDFRDADGATLLEIAKTGEIWMNLRRAMNIHPEYKEVLDQMYGGIMSETGVNALNPRGGILISSPQAKVPYHFDKTETILWHIRGKKSLYLYPLAKEFLSDEAFEESMINIISDDVPFKDEFDDHAQVFDLGENQGITWPLNTPHRVVNSTYCVSVTTEYSTPESIRKGANVFLNATLRRRFGLKPSYDQDSEIKRTIKSVFGRVMKKTGTGTTIEPQDFVTYKVKSDDYSLYDVEPYRRDF